MNQTALKQAYVAGSTSLFSYSGNAEDGLSIALQSGDSLLIRPQQLRDMLAKFAMFNPLLDDTNSGMFCPTARFESWVERDSRSFFGRQLENDDAMRILGAVYNEGLFETHFRYADPEDGNPPEADPVAALIECKSRIAVYREKGYYSLVRISQVSEKDRGVWLDLQILKSPGFRTELSGKINVGSNLDYFSIRRGFVVTSMVSWMLVTYPPMIERLIELAASQPERQQFIEGLYAITRYR